MQVDTMISPADLAKTKQQVDAHNARIKAEREALGLAGEKDMGQDKFLKLLTTQLRYQDPNSPMQNHEFAAQMAQFSALEQMTKLNGSMGKMLASSQAAETYGMLGKEIAWTDGAGKLARGVAGSIALLDGKPVLVVNGQRVEPSSVIEVRMPEKK